VVFADLADSTELAARLDPERLREVLAGFHGMVTDEITWLRGRAETFIGDAVLGVFGVPVAHDDDAVRGIRAALAIVDRAERLGKELGLPLPMRVRVGVNTGPVAVGAATDRNLVIGAEVNIGARLQQAARPGEVLVGATTRQLARDAVEFGPVRLIDAKGFEAEVPAWPVVRLAPHSARSTIPFIDRRRELALLENTFERVRDRERAHLVTLLGEPGIGKSRVVDEFLARLPEDVKVLAGRSSVFEETVTFRPIAEMIYREIGEDRDTSDDRVLDRLRGASRRWAEPGEADRAAHRLALALGLGEEATDENRYHAAEIRLGVLAMLQGVAAAGPVVLVFEDLEESDPLLLDLIEQLMRDARRLPLMVVCVARWEFLSKRSGWAGGLADAVTLWVEPLSVKQATELAMEAGDLGPDEAERVAVHAGGNPFFIVEITGMLMREEQALPPTGMAATARLLPPTVQAVIAARIDELSPPARELIRRASVFPDGRFDLDDLALVVQPKKDLLEEAESQELLVPEDERPGLWRFRSDVLRDVAYESLAKRERQRLHLRVANKLAADETRDRYPRTIAFHLEQAALASRDLNPRDRTLADRAVDALAHAGGTAGRRIESRAAADLYERALVLAGPEEDWGPREAGILSQLGEARYWLGEFDEAEASLRRALELGDESDELCAHASRFLGDISLTIRRDGDLAASLFDRALAAARRLGDPGALARTLLMAGWVPFGRDELGEARAMFEEALRVSRSGETPDSWAEVRSLVSLAAVTSDDGDERDALNLANEALEIGRASGQQFTIATAEEKVALSLRRMLRLDEALEHCEAAVAAYRELGAKWELAESLGDRGVIHRLAGRLEGAEDDLRQAFAICRDLNDRALVSWTAAELAKIQALRGDTMGARQTLEDPITRVAAADASWSASALHVTEAVVSLAEGDRDAALRHALLAVETERITTAGQRNALAAQVWWTARLFGAEAVGGDSVAEEARSLLEAHGDRQALIEPDLVSTPA
jgi:class 3 adenylate cyclase/tetratricopeptide (TPR) repeat protein